MMSSDKICAAIIRHGRLEKRNSFGHEKHRCKVAFVVQRRGAGAVKEEALVVATRSRRRCEWFVVARS